MHIVVNTDFVEIKEGSGCQACILPIKTNVGKSKLYFINEKVKVIKNLEGHVSSMRFFDLVVFLVFSVISSTVGSKFAVYKFAG